ncbi:hypothetical protein C8R44DRAFT_811413 [Mycena epipterygia]|nr:hypothetical protein C8R44DRAFT_811413 [Mycena epipterygia]
MSSAQGRKRKKGGKKGGQTNVRAPGGDTSAPKPKEWKTMTQYGSFTVVDDEGQDHTFKLGDTAAVLPGRTKVGSQIPAHRYWLVKIIEIRGRSPSHKTSEIWVLIRWYYSPKEVSCRIEGFNPSHCSKFERIYSDHSEVVSALTFDGLVPIVKFREDDPDQKPIGEEDFFTRYFLKTSSKMCEIELFSKNVQDPMGCICCGPYNLKSAASLDIQHMCPRPQCRRFYHSRCLLQHGHWTRKRLH